jgi:membrane protease YdiL (CAAX protease family)
MTTGAIVPNSREQIASRKHVGLLTWQWPVLMLFARSVFSILAQAVVAGIYVLRSSPAPWADAAGWFPVYGTLVDAGCLLLLWPLTRREGIGLFDLVGFDRGRWGRDAAIGLAIIPFSLLFIIGGISISSIVAYGTADPPALFGPLPLLPALYAALVFPPIWGLTEEMTYNGYIVPRLQVLSGSTILAVAIVSIPWSFQHAFQPLTFDSDFMLYRALAPLPHSVFIASLYLRIRRLLPFIVAHWLMNAGALLMTVLSPGSH